MRLHVAAVVCALSVLCLAVHAGEAEWVAAMKAVHSKGLARKGGVSQIGDSITYSKAFLAGVQWSALKSAPEWKPLAERVDLALLNERKGGAHCNYSGWTSGDGAGKIKSVIAEEKPEIAVIMYGTNDVTKNVSAEEYERNMALIVDTCLNAGCVPILTTIPPYLGKDAKVQALNDIVKKLAAEKKIPLVDFYAGILARQPGTAWNGTLLGKGDVHPSGGENFSFTEDNLKKCGYALRNFLTLTAIKDVIEKCF